VDGDAPAGLISKIVPTAKYAVFPASGKPPALVIAAWQKIRAAGLHSTYSGDFELYSAHAGGSPEQQVEIYVAVR